MALTLTDTRLLRLVCATSGNVGVELKQQADRRSGGRVATANRLRSMRHLERTEHAAGLAKKTHPSFEPATPEDVRAAVQDMFMAYLMLLRTWGVRLELPGPSATTTDAVQAVVAKQLFADFRLALATATSTDIVDVAFAADLV
jgi:hypothetical protein